jgi:hypothetical protein
LKNKPKKTQVSMRGETYALVKEHCEREGLSPGKFVDELCRAFLGLDPNNNDDINRVFSAEELQKLRMR